MMTDVQLVEMREWDPGEDPHAEPGHSRWALRDVRYLGEAADGPHYGGLRWQGFETADAAISAARKHGLNLVQVSDRPGEFMIYGLSVGHGCDDCERLTIAPAAVHTAGPSYELVASITAGDTHDGEARDGGAAERGHVNVCIEDLPKIIAELQKIYDRAVLADADQSIPADWPVHD